MATALPPGACWPGHSLDGRALPAGGGDHDLAGKPPGITRKAAERHFHELGQLLSNLSDYNDALAHWSVVEFSLHRRLGDARNQTIVMGRISDMLQVRG